MLLDSEIRIVQDAVPPAGAPRAPNLNLDTTMRTLIRSAVVAVAIALPSAAFAQSLTIHSVVDMQFQGALGGIMNMAARMGGASLHDVPTTTYLSGHRLRTDNDQSGTIFDLDGKRIINLNHKDKKYSVMTFEEMRAMLERATQQAEKDRAKNAKGNKDQSNDSVNVQYSVKVDRTGERQKVAGYDAERVFITIKMLAEATPENGKKEEVGSMVFLLDQWISTSAPQIAAYQEFYKAYSEAFGTEFRAQTQSLQAAFNSDPRLKDGFEAAAKELQKVQGISLRSTTHVVLVPAGMEFDRQAALNDAAASAAKAEAEKKDEKPKSGGLRGMMGAMKAAAEQASKQDNSKQSGPPKQSELMVTVDEVKSISTGAISADMFAPPAGYKLEKK